MIGGLKLLLAIRRFVAMNQSCGYVQVVQSRPSRRRIRDWWHAGIQNKEYMMRATRLVCVVLTAMGLCGSAHAVPISLFSDTDTFIERAQDIVIVKCVSVPKDGGIEFHDGLYPAEVEVLKTIKGKRALGRLTVATIYPMKPEVQYLLTNSGGAALNTDFLSLAELSVVSLPANAPLKELDGKTTRQQVQMAFAWSLHEVEQKLAPLLAEQKRLQRSLKDRDDDLFLWNGNVAIREVRKAITQNRAPSLSLEFPVGKLEWSHAKAGESGYFYFRSPGDGPLWEFAATDETEIQAFHGKPLRAKFFGSNSPSRDRRLGMSSSNAINVQVGQIVLARMTEHPQSILVIKLVEQSVDEEKLTISYTVIGKDEK